MIKHTTRFYRFVLLSFVFYFAEICSAEHCSNPSCPQTSDWGDGSDRLALVQFLASSDIGDGGAAAPLTPLAVPAAAAAGAGPEPVDMAMFAAERGLYNPPSDGLSFMPALWLALVGIDDASIVAAQLQAMAVPAAAAAGAGPEPVDMARFAAERGLYNPEGDGLCFLHAISLALVGIDDAGIVAQLQAMAVHQMLADPGHFADFQLGANPAQQVQALNAHLEGILAGNWAEDPMIQALVNAANLYLVVHNYDPFGNQIATYHFGSPSAPNHAVLYNIGNTHFLAMPPAAILPFGVVPHVMLGHPAAAATGFATPQLSSPPIAPASPSSTAAAGVARF